MLLAVIVIEFQKFIRRRKKNWLTFGHASVWSVFYTQLCIKKNENNLFDFV